MTLDVDTSELRRLADNMSGGRTAMNIYRAADALDAARERESTVRELHKSKTVTIGSSMMIRGGGGSTWTKETCDYCSQTQTGGAEFVGWPCATRRALDGAQ